ncbi:MAG: hypothetical protein ACRERD_33900 [Candidatus Binatia bacterium]
MKKSCIVSLFFSAAFWLFVMVDLSAPVQVLAQENHDHHSTDGNNHSPAEHLHEPAALIMPEGHMAGHHHRPSVLPPEEDRAYSELNHHIAGMFVLFAGGLAFLAAADHPRRAWAGYGWPALFFLLGGFLFVRHDPESWPWGPLPLWEAVADPQVLQHVLFTAIVLGIGVIEWLRYRGTLSHPLWGLIFPALGLAAAAMLFLHKHGSGPSAEKIYLHHAIMASAGIAAMLAKVLDDTRLLKSRVNAYLWPVLMMFIGVMLLLYAE